MGLLKFGPHEAVVVYPHDNPDTFVRVTDLGEYRRLARLGYRTVKLPRVAQRLRRYKAKFDYTQDQLSVNLMDSGVNLTPRQLGDILREERLDLLADPVLLQNLAAHLGLPPRLLHQAVPIQRSTSKSRPLVDAHGERIFIYQVRLHRRHHYREVYLPARSVEEATEHGHRLAARWGWKQYFIADVTQYTLRNGQPLWEAVGLLTNEEAQAAAQRLKDIPDETP